MPDKRISFFTSPIGLGHATRDVAIVVHLGADVSFTTGGGAARLLAGAGESVRDEYSPPRFEVDGSGKLRNPARWLWRYYRYYKDCKRIASRVIARENPDVVVSDEDFASIAVAQEMGIRTILITDILQTSFTAGWPGTAIEGRMNRAMREMMRRCDAVIMPEAGRSTRNVFRVGPITRSPSRTREEIRRACGFEKKTVLVSVGGTDAGAFLIDRVLDAMAAIDRGRAGGGTETVIVSGPSIEVAAAGRKGVRGRNARVMGYVDNLHEMILAADVLVSLAGRSTIDEAEAAGTPSVFIPIAGHFEQEANAARLGFSASDIDRLAEMIGAKLDEPRRPDADGANAATGDGGGSGIGGHHDSGRAGAKAAARLIASVAAR
ncbi:MAG: UDP-glucuronosyltransferase [Nitrosopumilaceae archaeon]|nr:UDP-glucuronosyltransferase [Nitrosopumilaceae archaeon]